MNGIELTACAPHSLLGHLALYGLAAICEDAGYTGIGLSWTAGMASRPRLSGSGLSPERVAATVHKHAQARAADGSWLREDFTVGSEGRALMSPRISRLARDGWMPLQQNRHRVIDALTAERRDLDLRLVGALGEPSYWRFDKKGELRQDEGASRLEMQPRNQGSEFVGTRLRKVAEAVGARDVSEVHDGLLGRRVRDEAGKEDPDGRSATGLDGPGPVDNAIVWCALWGISQFPLVLRANQAATTAGHVGPADHGSFYVPVWRGSWRPARLRSVLASDALRAVAKQEKDQRDDTTSLEAARSWLAARLVVAVVRFDVRVFGSANAPERRAGRGEIIPVRAEA